MKKGYQGSAHVYGDNVDTDRIIPGKYTKTVDLEELARHALEDIDPEFSTRVNDGDMVVAGENFGCGSSREHAPLAIKTAGVSVVIARYFARIFFRNAINVGLPVIELPDHTIEFGSTIRVSEDLSEVVDETAGKTYSAAPLSPMMVEILQAGGLAAYMRANGGYAQKETHEQ